MPEQRKRFVAAVATLFTACSLTSLDDLQSESKDATVADQCQGECLPHGGGTGGWDASGGFGSGFGGSGASGGTAGDGGVTDADAASPCTPADPQCQQCCVSATGMGATDYLKAIYDCICSLTTICQIECDAYCQTQADSGVQLDPVCTQCLGSSEVQQCLLGECSSTECKAYTACVSQC